MIRPTTAFLLFTLSGSFVVAGDWPQILGSNRNGIAVDEKLNATWDKTGPPLLWEISIGHSFAGVAVQGETVILFHRERSNEVIEALNAQSGERLWRDEYPTTFYPQVGGGDGPLCVPTIHGEYVITYGAQGVLTCNELKTGKNLWRRMTHTDFDAREGYFGAGSCPLVIKENVIVNVGGRKNDAGVVAFDLKTGETRWQQTDEPASYSAPTIAVVEGLEQILIVTRYKCMMLDPDKGAMRFQFPFGSRGPTVNGATPLVFDNHLLVTSSYGVGSTLKKINFFGAENVWEDERIMASQYCTPILADGHVYIVDGRDDVPPADLKCFDPMTHKLKWTQPDVGYGTLIFADGKLLFQKTDGELVLVQPNTESYVELAKAKPFKNTVRALPALSNGRYYIHDDTTLKCLNLAPLNLAP